jgi:hypothetical protein
MSETAPDVATITITQTEAPSRSKQAGPCWIRLDGPGDPTYASTTNRTIAVPTGSAVTAEGKATLRRATRTTTDRGSWTLTATGNPDDTVTLAVPDYGTQVVVVEIRGAVLA